MQLRFSVVEDAHKGPNHPLGAAIRLVLLLADTMTVSVMHERTAGDDLFTTKVLMAVHLKWYEWRMATYQLPLPHAHGENATVPPPDFSGLFKDLCMQL